MNGTSMVSIGEVKKAALNYETNELNALLGEMEKYGMSRIEEEKFYQAANRRDCPECGEHAIIGSQKQCSYCTRWEQRMAQSKQYKKRWEALLKELNRQDKSGNEYSIVAKGEADRSTSSVPSYRLIRTATINDTEVAFEATYNCTVKSSARNRMRHHYHDYSRYLFVKREGYVPGTDNKDYRKVMSDLYADKVDYKKIAEKLIKKFDELIEEEELRMSAAKLRQEKENQVGDNIKSNVVHLQKYDANLVKRLGRHGYRKDGYKVYVGESGETNLDMTAITRDGGKLQGCLRWLTQLDR